MAYTGYLDAWGGNPLSGFMQPNTSWGAMPAATPAPAYAPVWNPPPQNLGATGYNPQGSGPLNDLSAAGVNRFSAFQQAAPNTGFENQALARGQTFAPYLSMGLPGQTVTRGMSAGDYFSGGPQQQSLNFLTQASPFAETNPYLTSFMQAAAQPLVQQFTEQAMPAIGSDFSMSGMTGSSRQGIAEGIAARGLADAISRSNLSLANSGYSQGLQAMMSGLQLGQGSYEDTLRRQLASAQLGSTDYEAALNRQLQGTQAGSSQYYQRALAENSLLGGAQDAARLGLMPSQIVGSIGDQRQQQSQRAIDDAMARWQYAQQLPIDQLNRYATTIGAIPTSNFGSETQKSPSSLLGTAAGALGSIGSISNSLGGLFGLF